MEWMWLNERRDVLHSDIKFRKNCLANETKPVWPNNILLDTAFFSAFSHCRFRVIFCFRVCILLTMMLGHWLDENQTRIDTMVQVCSDTENERESTRKQYDYPLHDFYLSLRWATEKRVEIHVKLLFPIEIPACKYENIQTDKFIVVCSWPFRMLPD